MSQRAFLAQLDAQIHSSFMSGGLADLGQYTVPVPSGELAPSAVNVAVVVDRDIETIGTLRQFRTGSVEVTYVQPAVIPAKGGKLVVDGESFINEAKLSDDGSMVRWKVRRG